jgi:MATE family multidrug resistance protein
MVGGALGARDRRALRRSIRVTGEWAAGLALLFATGYALAGPQIVGLLTDIDEVRAQAALYLPWIVASPIVSVWSFMLDGIFIGATRGREMRNAMMASFAAYLIALWLAKSVYADEGLWLAFLVFLAVRALTLALLYPRIERAAT